MWGIESREQNHKSDEACWNRVRHAAWESQPAEQYFEDVYSGRCAHRTTQGSTGKRWCKHATTRRLIRHTGTANSLTIAYLLHLPTTATNSLITADLGNLSCKLGASCGQAGSWELG